MGSLTVVLGVLSVVAVVLLIGTSMALRRATARARRLYTERAEALSQRARLEASIASGRSRLDALGEATSDGLLLLDANRLIVWANAAAWNIFDSAGPQLGQPFIVLARDSELNQAVVDAVTGGRSMIRQALVGARSLRICAAPATDAGGVAVCVQDVSELQRLGRARRDFVANISHELRTPLSNIDLAAQTLRQGLAGDPALARRMLDQIQVQVQILSQLSQEMMELAQIESGKVLLKLLPEEVEPVVRHSVMHLLPQAALKDQHISLVVPRGLIALMDDQQISRVLDNLVHNAVKFTPEGGIISVYGEPLGDDDVCVCVADTGPGVAKEDQNRIFERFYKADRSRAQAGTGLGLAIARHIIEGHGGRIWVESTPGQGATFCFTLPKA